MARFSSAIITTLNAISLIVSLLAVGGALWIRANGESECHRSILLPLLVFGLFLFVVSVFGLTGSCCGISFFLYVYLFILLLLIVGVFCFTLFSIIVTNKAVGGSIPVGNFPLLLQRYVFNADNWDQIKSCLVAGGVCQNKGEGRNSVDFAISNLSDLQSGCCVPPEECGMVRKNATVWEAVDKRYGVVEGGGDCKAWSNDMKKLCYNCSTCKVGFLESIRSQWRTLAIANSSALAFLVIVYSVGCCAVRGRHRHKHGRNRGHP